MGIDGEDFTNIVASLLIFLFEEISLPHLPPFLYNKG
jgi:hypothetical protein